MGKFSAAATTNHATLDALVDSNARLSVTIEEQHGTIRSLRKENGTLLSRGKSGLGGGSNTSSTTGRFTADQEKLLTNTLKKGWYVGGSLSTHSQGVNHGHTSVTCT